MYTQRAQKKNLFVKFTCAQNRILEGKKIFFLLNKGTINKQTGVELQLHLFSALHKRSFKFRQLYPQGKSPIG